jgi:hypothetical protein
MNEQDASMLTLSRIGSKELLSILDGDDLTKLDAVPNAPAPLSRVSSRDSQKEVPNTLSRTSSRDSNTLFLDVFTDQNVPLNAGLSHAAHNNLETFPSLVRVSSKERLLPKLQRTPSNELILGACEPELSPTSKMIRDLDSGQFGVDAIETHRQQALPLQPSKRTRCVSQECLPTPGFFGPASTQFQQSHSAPDVSFGAQMFGAVPEGGLSFYQPSMANLVNGTIPNQMQVDSPKASQPDEWEGKRIVMKKGKYAGRGAFVKERVNKKYRVEIDGVNMKLEFYSTSFDHVVV